MKNRFKIILLSLISSLLFSVYLFNEIPIDSAYKYILGDYNKVYKVDIAKDVDMKNIDYNKVHYKDIIDSCNGIELRKYFKREYDDKKIIFIFDKNGNYEKQYGNVTVKGIKYKNKQIIKGTYFLSVNKSKDIVNLKKFLKKNGYKIYDIQNVNKDIVYYNNNLMYRFTSILFLIITFILFLSNIVYNTKKQSILRIMGFDWIKSYKRTYPYILNVLIIIDVAFIMGLQLSIEFIEKIHNYSFIYYNFILFMLFKYLILIIMISVSQIILERTSFDKSFIFNKIKLDLFSKIATLFIGVLFTIISFFIINQYRYINRLDNMTGLNSKYYGYVDMGFSSKEYEAPSPYSISDKEFNYRRNNWKNFIKNLGKISLSMENKSILYSPSSLQQGGESSNLKEELKLYKGYPNNFGPNKFKKLGFIPKFTSDFARINYNYIYNTKILDIKGRDLRSYIKKSMDKNNFIILIPDKYEKYMTYIKPQLKEDITWYLRDVDAEKLTNTKGNPYYDNLPKLSFDIYRKYIGSVDKLRIKYIIIDSKQYLPSMTSIFPVNSSHDFYKPASYPPIMIVYLKNSPVKIKENTYRNSILNGFYHIKKSKNTISDISKVFGKYNEYGRDFSIYTTLYNINKNKTNNKIFIGVSFLFLIISFITLVFLLNTDTSNYIRNSYKNIKVKQFLGISFIKIHRGYILSSIIRNILMIYTSIEVSKNIVLINEKFLWNIGITVDKINKVDIFIYSLLLGIVFLAIESIILYYKTVGKNINLRER